jgi:hypothetical protein
VSGASVVAGFAAAAPLARSSKLGPLGALFATPIVLLVLLVLGLQKRLGTSASYAQFHGGFGTEPITRTDLGRGLLWMLAVLVLGIAWSVRLLRKVHREDR